MLSPFGLAAPAVPDFFQECDVPFLEDDEALSLNNSGELDELMVPDAFKKCEADLWDLGELFPADSSSEASTVLALTPTVSDATTRCTEFGSPGQQLDSPVSRSQQVLPLRPAAPATLPPSGLGLTLKLDYSSVASAWGELSGGRPALRLPAAELASLAVNIPSLQDRAATLSAEAALAAAGSESSQGGASSIALTEEELAARRAALARYKEKKSARSSSNPSKKVRYEMRRINAEKRPRIKGRFVKKSELEMYLAQQASAMDDCLVPAY